MDDGAAVAIVAVTIVVVTAAAAAVLLCASACEEAATTEGIVSPVEAIWLRRWERVAGVALGLGRESARWARKWGM